ncbi:MAG: tripartite tricarboxylate transporter substrate-binding protein, partial [Casimicrobiaceae bacterium]
MSLPTRLFSILAGFLCLVGLAQAQQPTWPTKPVTLLVPFPAGGTVDIVARTIGQKLSVELGQSFIVENHGGAGGSIGTALLAHANPDGYTLLVPFPAGGTVDIVARTIGQK